MEAPSQSAAQEAKQLNIKLEQEDGEWIAVLPSHPDLKNDEEIGLPAPTEAEALDEARAYRSIEQSKVYKFEYDEKRDLYLVTFNDRTFEAKYLAHAYRDAQKAYAQMINQPEPPKAAEPTPPKQRKRRASSNGGAPPVEREQITSGIGDKPTQLAPPAEPPPQLVENPWITLEVRITRLENVLRDAITATARALEELKNR